MIYSPISTPALNAIIARVMRRIQLTTGFVRSFLRMALISLNKARRALSDGDEMLGRIYLEWAASDITSAKRQARFAQV